MQSSQTRTKAIALGGIIGLLSLGGWSAFYSNSTRQFTQAQAAWASHHPERYRMTMVYGDRLGGATPCQQTVEVNAETVVQLLDNTCSPSDQPAPKTVSDIFAHFHPIATERTCGPNGCSCDGSVQVNAEYDDTWQYPRQISTTLAPDRLSWAYWKGRLSNQPCTQIGFIGERVEITSFESLP